MSLRPSNAPKDVFYLKPLASPQEHCWYSARPVGHNPLSDTVKRLCNQVATLPIIHFAKLVRLDSFRVALTNNKLCQSLDTVQ